jgi:hypothetical protein
MPVARRELYLGHGRVFVETPLLMTDDELASVFEAFVKEVRGRAPKGPAEVFIEVPRLMTDDERADVFEAFVKKVRGRATKAPPEPPEPSKGRPLPPHRYPKKRR